MCVVMDAYALSGGSVIGADAWCKEDRFSPGCPAGTDDMPDIHVG